MPIWIQAVLAAVSFASELLKFMREQDGKVKAEHVEKMKSFSDALKRGDTSEIEAHFKSLRLPSPKPN